MRTRAGLGVGLLLCGVAAACASVLGIDDVQYAAGTDAGDASTPPDQAAADAGSEASTCFTCGNKCVAYENPAFGCNPAGSCQPCPGGSNADPTCTSGACALACKPGFANCNGTFDDGCEVRPSSDKDHCGSCSTPCGATEFCVDASCVASCLPPLTPCSDGTCDNVANDPRHCGNCGTVCPGATTGGNGGPTCTAGQCTYACSAGYMDCDSNLGNGCETQVNGNNPDHCGSCAACPTGGVNAAPDCNNGACSLKCNTGWDDCNDAGVGICDCNVGDGVHACFHGACCLATNSPCGNTPTGCCSGLCDFGTHTCN